MAFWWSKSAMYFLELSKCLFRIYLFTPRKIPIQTIINNIISLVLALNVFMVSKYLRKTLLKPENNSQSLFIITNNNSSMPQNTVLYIKSHWKKADLIIITNDHTICPLDKIVAILIFFFNIFFNIIIVKLWYSDIQFPIVILADNNKLQQCMICLKSHLQFLS